MQAEVLSFTDQQLQIIRADQSLKVQAYAGSGKSTCLLQYIIEHPEETIIYACYNRLNREYFERQCHQLGLDNVLVYTIHYLAKFYVYGHRKVDLCNSHDFGRLREFFQADLFGIPLADQPKVIFWVQDLVRQFCYSTQRKLIHFDYLSVVSKQMAFEISARLDLIYKLAGKLLAAMYEHKFPILHDFYIKLFYNQGCIIKCNTLLVDEAQDMNDAMIFAMHAQPMKKIFVGDSHQQIYSWRGANNSIEKIALPAVHMTESFRYGSEVAKFASRVLSWKPRILKSAPVAAVIKGSGPQRHEQGTVHLTRRSVSLLRAALAELTRAPGSKFVFLGGLPSYLTTDHGISLDVLHRFYSGQTFNNPFLEAFPSYNVFKEYAQVTEDHTILGFISLVESYGSRFQYLLGSLRKSEVGGVKAMEQPPDLTFANVHRVKGRQFEEVILDGDFLGPDELTALKRKGGRGNTQLMEEINAVYVAATRATKTIQVDNKLLY